MLHGVFGQGTNFRTVARGLAAKRPDWGFVLIDLRGHGESQGFEGPHDLDAAAADVERLAASLGRRVEAVIGHSFGGKVALTLLARRALPLRCAFILDSAPGPRAPALEHDAVAAVLAALESLPPSLPSREAFKVALAQRGFSAHVVEWLAMSVRRSPGRADYALRLDLPAIRAMLEDYWAKDLWSVIEEPGAAERLVLVLGGRSTVVSGESRARAEAAGRTSARVEVLTLAGASHWLHVDDPDGLTAAIAPRLSGG